MMNKERILRLADTIEQKEVKYQRKLSILNRIVGKDRFFNMGRFRYSCGAPA